MASQEIEDHGMIGNMCTVALVALNGQIDWYCYPRFDSPSVFGALLDDAKGGRFQIAADGGVVKQLYWPDTNVLITRFLSEQGVGEIYDFMPAGSEVEARWQDQLVRRVRVVRGSVTF